MSTYTDGHVFDDLPLLLAGEADRPTVLRAADHLRSCSDCRHDLVDAVVAHATLRSAARTAPDVATGGRLAFAPTVPGDDLPQQLTVAASVALSDETPIDLSPVFAQIRREAAAASDEAGVAPAAMSTASGAAGASTVPTADPASNVVPLRRRRLQRGLLAAAAVVVIGGGTAAIVTQTGDDGRTVPVSAFGAGNVDASATVGNGWVRLDASKLPVLPIDEYYEVWLVDRPATGLLALGSLGEDRTGTFSLPPAVMSNYPTVQVTVQQNNGDPRPSDTSVLRGTL